MTISNVNENDALIPTTGIHAGETVKARKIMVEFANGKTQTYAFGSLKHASPAPVTPPTKPVDPSSSDSFMGYADSPPTKIPGYRPFSASSPFNVKHGSAHPDSPAMVANMIKQGWSVPNPVAGAPRDDHDYQHPRFFARTADPVFTIKCSDYTANGHKIYVPFGARPAGASDGHLEIVQPNGRAYGMWAVSKIDAAAKTITCANALWQDYTGIGCVPTKSESANGGPTASGFDLDAGVIRPQHILDGHIPHALFTVLSALLLGVAWKGPGMTGPHTDYVWPANHGESNPSTTLLLPAMGDRLFLNATAAEIDAQQGVSPFEKIVQKCYAEFGGLIGDRGGTGFLAESKWSPGARDQWEKVAALYGMRFDSEWGYTFRFTSPLWKSRLQVQARNA